MRIVLVVGIMAALGLAGAGGALAQGNPFNPLVRLKLSSEDIAMAGSAADQLYEAGAVGEVAAWSNDATGNSGQVKLLEMFEYEGYACKAVEHVIKTAKNPDPNTLVVKSCLAEDGTWKLI
jgi:surface antigen